MEDEREEGKQEGKEKRGRYVIFFVFCFFAIRNIIFHHLENYIFHLSQLK